MYIKSWFVACLFVSLHYFWRSNSPIPRNLNRIRCSLWTSLFQFTTKVNHLRSLLYNLSIILFYGNYKGHKEKDCFPSSLSYANCLMLALHHLAGATGLVLPVLPALNLTKNAYWQTQRFLCKLQLILNSSFIDVILTSDLAAQPNWSRKHKRKLVKTRWSGTLNKHQHCWWHWQVTLMRAYSQKGIGD